MKNNPYAAYCHQVISDTFYNLKPEHAKGSIVAALELCAANYNAQTHEQLLRRLAEERRAHTSTFGNQALAGYLSYAFDYFKAVLPSMPQHLMQTSDWLQLGFLVGVSKNSPAAPRPRFAVIMEQFQFVERKTAFEAYMQLVLLDMWGRLPMDITSRVGSTLVELLQLNTNFDILRQNLYSLAHYNLITQSYVDGFNQDFGPHSATDDSVLNEYVRAAIGAFYLHVSEFTNVENLRRLNLLDTSGYLVQPAFVAIVNKHRGSCVDPSIFSRPVNVGYQVPVATQQRGVIGKAVQSAPVSVSTGELLLKVQNVVKHFLTNNPSELGTILADMLHYWLSSPKNEGSIDSLLASLNVYNPYLVVSPPHVLCLRSAILECISEAKRNHNNTPLCQFKFHSYPPKSTVGNQQTGVIDNTKFMRDGLSKMSEELEVRKKGVVVTISSTDNMSVDSESNRAHLIMEPKSTLYKLSGDGVRPTPSPDSLIAAETKLDPAEEHRGEFYQSVTDAVLKAMSADPDQLPIRFMRLIKSNAMLHRAVLDLMLTQHRAIWNPVLMAVMADYEKQTDGMTLPTMTYPQSSDEIHQVIVSTLPHPMQAMYILDKS